MAKSENGDTPPSYTITAPSTLSPIMEAFYVDSEEAAHALILKASKAIYGSKNKDSSFDLPAPGDREISKGELNGIASLMKRLSPKDSLESLYAAQIVATHMVGMRKLSSSYSEDQRLGLKLLKFCNDTLKQLEKKRNGGKQSITVNHNDSSSGGTHSQTIVKEA